MRQETTLDEQIVKEIKSGKYRQRYLVYIRKSTDEPNNQKNSIKYQKAEALRFVEREKLPLALITSNGFCRDGLISEKHSGFEEDIELTFTKDGKVQYRIERPKFQKLVEFLSLGLFKGVICLCWDRISRNRGDDTVIRKLMRKGVDIQFVYAKYDDTSAGALHMDIDGMFAQHHSRVTAEKVRLATWDLRGRGVVTYKAPIGYLNLGNMEHKPFDPERAPIIKKLFELYATGDWSLSDLVRFGSEQGLTTVPVRRRRTREEMLAEEEDDQQLQVEKVSRRLATSHLHHMLRNPFYIGRVRQRDGKPIRSVSHEALVSDELFEKVQAILTKKAVSVHYDKKLQYPYRGLIRCADCRRIYTPYVQKGIHYYASRCVKGCANSRKNFNAAFLESEVGKLIERLSFTEEELVKLDATNSTNVALLEEKRLQELDVIDRQKRKIREDLAYLRTNKLQLLKTAVYSPEALREQEDSLDAKLHSLQRSEETSDVSMKAVMEDMVKLSELLKYGSAYYILAKPREKEQLIRLIFSELSLSGNTLSYQCKKGFQALETRFVADCCQTAWLSEAMQSHKLILESIHDIEELLPTHQARAA
jgi:site-specific DNA recombinase